MSRNLCRDDCVKCGYTFTLGDMRGKPIEFRQYYRYNPTQGCKLVCPTCGMVYFAWIRYRDQYWSEPENSREDYFVIGSQRFENREKGKFVIECKDLEGKSYLEDIGSYQIDLSYYESYNDEGEGLDTENPAYLFMENDYELGRWRNPGRSYLVNGEWVDTIQLEHCDKETP